MTVKLMNNCSGNSTTEPVAPLAEPPTPTPFTLPEALTAPLQMLMAGQPTPQQMAMLKPYQHHWTAGAYFTVCVMAIALACLYVLFLFQLGAMLRRRHHDDDVSIRPATGTATNKNMNTKRSSWSSRGSGRTRPTTRVMQALKNKKISAPSPIPEEFEDGKRTPATSESGVDFTSAEGSGSRGHGQAAIPRFDFTQYDTRPGRRLREFL